MSTILTIGPVAIPSPKEFGVVWSTFFLTVSAIATYRANHYGPRRFGELTIHAANLLVEAVSSKEFSSSVEQMANDQREKVSLGILYEELLFVSWRYRDAFSQAEMETPEIVSSMTEPAHFSGENGHAGDAFAVSNIETVKGSIQPLLDKLPPWIRKGIEAIMEALKLTRGEVD